MTLRTKAKISFVEFLRPDGYWPNPYSLEQAFHVLQWMVKTGHEHQKYGRSGPIELLSKKPTCICFGEIDPITSIADLRSRFHHALLSKWAADQAKAWRAANQIDVQTTKILTFRHYPPFSGGGLWRCEGDVGTGLRDLFHHGSTQRTALSLNSIHTTARTCKDVRIHVSRRGFRFVLTYGWPDEESSSCWSHELARTEGDEPFLDGLARAVTALAELTERVPA